MANDKQIAAATLRAEASRLQGLTQLADDLERLGSMEAVIADAERRLEAVRADEAKAAKAVERANAAAAKIILDAERRASRIVAEAEALQANAARMEERIRGELNYSLNVARTKAA